MRIFFDTEFIDNGRTVDLISIGLIREDGEHYYAEAAECDRSKACEWVQKNVFPHLNPASVKTRALIRADLTLFCGERPEFWAYYASYDWLCLSQLFGRMLDVPLRWPNMPMDIMQLAIFMGKTRKDLPEQAGPEHNALADAIWNKQAFDYLTASPAALTNRQQGKEAERPESEQPADDYKFLYMELLLAVGKKWPGETRHQTALRYIQRAEQPGDNRPAQKAKSVKP